MSDKIRAYGLLAAMKGGVSGNSDSTIHGMISEVATRPAVLPSSRVAAVAALASASTSVPLPVIPSAPLPAEVHVTQEIDLSSGTASAPSLPRRSVVSPRRVARSSPAPQAQIEPSSSPARPKETQQIHTSIPGSRKEDEPVSIVALGHSSAAAAGSPASPPAAALSGQYIASLMGLVGPTEHGSNLDAKVPAAARTASVSEVRHEIVALGGDGQLALNEPNWAKFRSESDAAAPTLVLSFLGDTSAGKSHTIRELLSDEVERPYCQQAASQMNATTFNVNLFVCKTLVPGVSLNFLDYEGENGTDTPVMAAVCARVMSQHGCMSV